MTEDDKGRENSIDRELPSGTTAQGDATSENQQHFYNHKEENTYL